jgi:methylmalonyl-CoA/ethylmalonyl-CoA epimerase
MALTSPSYLVSQMALLVNDLDQVMRDYCDNLGWGPWKIYEYRSPWLRDLKVRGEPAEFTWLGAEAVVGNVWVEILQPLEGESPFTDWLARHGDGVHHMGYEVQTMDEARTLHREFEAQGAPELLSAWCGDMFLFYMDTKPLVTEVWVGSAADLTPDRVYPPAASLAS